VAFAGGAGEVQLWNVATGVRVLLLKAHTAMVWSLAFSPDGKWLATGGSDQLRLWNIATGKEEWKLIGHGSEVKSVAFAPDGQTLATGGKDATVMLWSTAPKQAEVVITNVNLPPSFSPDSKLLATSKFGGPVTIWDVAARQPVWMLNSERRAQFPSEGRTLATLSTNRTLRFWDVASHSLQRSVPLPGISDSTQHHRIELRGNRLAAGDSDGYIAFYDTTTGDLISKFKPLPESMNWVLNGALTFSPDARLLATVGDNRPVKLWDVATQKELTVASSHQHSAQGLAFSPDGSLLASGSWDDTVGFLRVATGKSEAPLTGFKEGCSGVAFSPDARTLAVACEDGTVKLWNLATRREVAVLRHGKPAVRYVVFSPDGQTLVSVCSEDGTMRFWEAPSADATTRQP
jgi:WD40 repeat protein